MATTWSVFFACSAVLAAVMQTTPPTNPVGADATSVAAGKKLFSSNCVSCHGENAQGDGKMASQLNPKPANLTNDTWTHGSSDGEIFSVIRDGVKNTGMKAFGSRMTAHQIWDVVNYLRSIGPGTSDRPR
jgi:putative copper resistance protein D